MRRKRRIQEVDVETTDRWLVSYADFITLLFAFFVAMYAISSVNEGKYRVLASSIVEAFNEPAVSKQGEEEKQQFETPQMQDEISPIELDHLKQDSLTEDVHEIESDDGSSPQQQTVVTNQKSSSGTQNDTEVIQEKSAADIAEELEQEMAELIDQGAVSVKQSDDWIEVEIKNNVLFPSGSARLNEEAIPILSKLSSIFIEFSNPIQVEGFTDNQPINTIAFPSNWELSAARAASVVHLLMKVGIKPTRMVAVGYGEHRPIADNTTEEGRQQNRRIAIIIPTADTTGHVIDTTTKQMQSGPSGQKRIQLEQTP